MKRALNDKVGLQLTNNDVSAIEIMDLYEMYISSHTNTHDTIHLAQADEKINTRFILLNVYLRRIFLRLLEKHLLFPTVEDLFQIKML